MGWGSASASSCLSGLASSLSQEQVDFQPVANRRRRVGNLFVISGPSGAGKGLLLSRALPRIPDAWVSVSVTTRAPRPGEVDGLSYHFKTADEFAALRDQGGLLEWATVHGHSYGTPRDQVASHVEAGYQVILEIDVQGALQVRESFPSAYLIFIAPPSLDELDRRLRGRGTETSAEVSRRLTTAGVELSQQGEYDCVIVNDDIDAATDRLVAAIGQRAQGSRKDS